MPSLLRELSLGARALARAPVFTGVSLLTIALGVGASTAIFSVVNAVLLRPLPYGDADRLVLVWGDMRARDVTDFPFPPADYHDLREQATLFEALDAVVTFRSTLLSEGNDPEQVRVAGVTTGLPRTLGARVVLGRDFMPDDATPQAPPPEGVPEAEQPPPLPQIALLSHGFWQRRFGGDPEVVGRTLEVGGQLTEVVGVLGPEAELLFPPGTNVERVPDVWTAMRLDFAGGSRINVFLRLIGKLQPGVSVAQAEAQVEGIAAELRRQFPIKETSDLHFRVEPMHDDLVAGVRPAILALLGAGLLVLLIACANVANLHLVRSAAREGELAVRSALGASRGRLIRKLAAESLVLAVGGAVAGLGVAWAGIRLLLRLRPDGLPRLETVALDPLVVAFAVLVCLAAAVLFGLWPALRASRIDVAGTLRESGRSAALAGGGRLADAVVVAEVALCFVLLIGTGLMLRSYAALQDVDPGYRTDGLLTLFIDGRGDGDERAVFKRELAERLRGLPGVTGVTAAFPLPLDGAVTNVRWAREEDRDDPARYRQANSHFVLPGYFETMGTRLLAGRTFTEADNDPEATVVVIDELMARAAFGDQPAVGRQLPIRVRIDEMEMFEVIGVVAHQRHAALTEPGPEAVFFTDGLVGHFIANRWAVRSPGDPPGLAAAVRREVAALDPLLAVAEVRPMSDLVDAATAPTRFGLVLITVFGVVAVILAGIGLFGVVSTRVRQRRAEIGVRVAFGAPRQSVVALVLRHGMLLSGAGVAAGVAAAALISRTLSSMLVGVEPLDALTFAATAAAVVLVSLVSCALPAIRASAVDPVESLRSEGG